MEPIGPMLDWVGEGNRHHFAAVEVGAVPSKINPVVAYILSTDVRLRSCMEVTPISRNGRGRSQDSFISNTSICLGWGVLSPATVVPVK